MADNITPATVRNEIMTRVTVKAWTDTEFAARLQADPVRVLREEGLELVDDFEGKLYVHFDGNGEKHFVIPSPPSVVELKEAELRTLASQRLSIQLELF